VCEGVNHFRSNVSSGRRTSSCFTSTPADHEPLGSDNSGSFNCSDASSATRSHRLEPKRFVLSLRPAPQRTPSAKRQTASPERTSAAYGRSGTPTIQAVPAAKSSPKLWSVRPVRATQAAADHRASNSPTALTPGSLLSLLYLVRRAAGIRTQTAITKQLLQERCTGFGANLSKNLDALTAG